MIAQTNRVDLHTHSSASDGTDSPRELVAHARELGLRAIALTDHDTVDGVKEALAAGAEYGVEVLPGIGIFRRLPGHWRPRPGLPGGIQTLQLYRRSLTGSSRSGRPATKPLWTSWPQTATPSPFRS